MPLKFKTTAEIKTPKPLADQIIGQEDAVEVMKKAAKQRRNVLLIGDPGIGKSLTAQALAELLPKENLTDIIALPNPTDDNNPKIHELPRGEGKKLVEKARLQSMSSMKNQNFIFFILVILTVLTPWWIRKQYGDIMAAASLIGSMIFLAAFVLFMNLSKRMKTNARAPKLLVDNSDKKKSPFIDATGTHAGALLGDCLHDPLQSYSSVVNFYEIVNSKENGLIQLKEKQMSTKVEDILKNHEKEVINQKDYRATFLNKEELMTLGEKNNNIELIDVLSVNKHKNNHKHLIKLTTESGKELIVTPEHKVAVKRFGTIIYKEAAKLTRLDKVISLDV
jgi:Lon-like ATP-dependent protease